MRIIAGKFKGKKLLDFNVGSTRPTSDMVKQVLFDCLGNKIDNCVFLDLFSGTGNIGIEALSRNARKVIFVDNNIKCIELINKNIYSLNMNNYAIVNKDSNSALEQLSKDNYKFDIVFLDPPYASNFAEKSFKILQKSQLLNDDAIIIWEHDNTKLNNMPEDFEIIKQKKQGIKYLTFLKFKQKGIE